MQQSWRGVETGGGDAPTGETRSLPAWRRGCTHRGDALPARLLLQHEAAILTDPRRPSQEPELRAGADRPPQPALRQLTLPRGPRSLKQGREGSGVLGLREGQRENQGLRGLE